MSEKQKLQEKIAKLQAELHILQVKQWWEARPHIAEFMCSYNDEPNDDGFCTKYFYAYNIVLSHEWIKCNGVRWQTFCDHLGIPLYPADNDVVTDSWHEYMRSIDTPDNYKIDYPAFIEHYEKTIRNPNYVD